MKCPKCQRENTLKRAENNTVVCAACGSRFPLKTPAKPAAPQPQPSPAPSQPIANVDDKTLSALLDGVKHIDDAPAPTPNVETTYSLRSESAPTPPPVPPTQFKDYTFDRRGAAETPDDSTARKSEISAQTSSEENRPSLFSWSGRATQREFLGAVGWYILWSCVAAIFFWFAAGLFSNASQSEELDNPLSLAQLLVTFLLGLASLAGYGAATLFFFAASARRLRDAGLSPYLTLLHFVVSLPLTIFLAVYPGQTGPTDAPKSEPRLQTPQAQQSPQPNATPAPSTATLGWLRFFSWNAPARPTDLPLALAAYFTTAFLVATYTIFDVWFCQTAFSYFAEHFDTHYDLFEKNFSFSLFALDFIQTISLFFQLSFIALNLTALGVSILTAAKSFRD